MRAKSKIVLTIISITSLLIMPQVSALSSSSNYSVNEVQFGSGSGSAASSTYQSNVSIGSLGGGKTSSTNYRADAGFLTQNVPYLEMAITGPSVNLGTLSSNTTAYGDSKGGACNCTFYVRTYLSSQYIVTTMSNPPTSESNHVFTAKSVQGAPSASTSVEEFGINLVANTVPAAFGGNAFNDPDNTFADGTAATGYNVANQYKYAVGDTIARSAKTATNAAVGQTDYTISYIIKNSNITPAGTYVMNQDIVATATY